MSSSVRGMAGGSEFRLPFGLHRKPGKGEAPALRPIFPRKEAIVLAFVHLPTMQQQKLHSSPRSVIHPRPVLIGSPVVFPPAQYVDLGTPNATRTVAAVPSPAVQRARMDVSSARERDFLVGTAQLLRRNATKRRQSDGPVELSDLLRQQGYVQGQGGAVTHDPERVTVVSRAELQAAQADARNQSARADEATEALQREKTEQAHQAQLLKLAMRELEELRAQVEAREATIAAQAEELK